MPIINVHSPRRIVTLFPQEIASAEVALTKLRDEGAQATICEPNFFGCITPTVLKDRLARRTELWLSVDNTGEIATVEYSTSRPQEVYTLMTRRHERGIDVAVDLTGRVRPLGADYGKDFTASITTGRGFTARELIGGLIMYRNAEMAEEIMGSFPPLLPPQPPAGQ